MEYKPDTKPHAAPWWFAPTVLMGSLGLAIVAAALIWWFIC